MQIKMARLSPSLCQNVPVQEAFRSPSRRRSHMACVRRGQLGNRGGWRDPHPDLAGCLTSSAAGSRCRRDGTADVQVSQMSVFNCPAQGGSRYAGPDRGWFWLTPLLQPAWVSRSEVRSTLFLQEERAAWNWTIPNRWTYEASWSRRER